MKETKAGAQVDLLIRGGKVVTPGYTKTQWIAVDGGKIVALGDIESMMPQARQTIDASGKYDIRVKVRGGGESGQAGAIKHGISRAILKIDDEFRPTLKKAGYLTRDSRIKERKKYGQKGARARFQFSKR